MTKPSRISPSSLAVEIANLCSSALRFHAAQRMLHKALTDADPIDTALSDIEARDAFLRYVETVSQAYGWRRDGPTSGSCRGDAEACLDRIEQTDENGGWPGWMWEQKR